MQRSSPRATPHGPRRARPPASPPRHPAGEGPPKPAARGVAGQAPGADPVLDADALALHRVVSDLVRMFQFRDRDRICCHDVSVTQCYALEALAVHGELTLNELAAELYLDKSTASRVVDSLVAKGYAERRPHPEDGRAVRLTVTRAGRRLYERIDGELLAEVRGVVAAFPPAVRQSMAEMLHRLLRAAGPRLTGGATGGSCCSGVELDDLGAAASSKR